MSSLIPLEKIVCLLLICFCRLPVYWLCTSFYLSGNLPSKGSLVFRHGILVVLYTKPFNLGPMPKERLCGFRPWYFQIKQFKLGHLDTDIDIDWGGLFPGDEARPLHRHESRGGGGAGHPQGGARGGGQPRTRAPRQHRAQANSESWTLMMMMIDDNDNDDCQVSHVLHAGPHQEIKLLHTIHTLKQ